MSTRIVDARLFALEAAYVDWVRILRQRAGDPSGRLPVEGASRVVSLRWHVNAGRGNSDERGVDRGIGLPTGPFTVWRRPSYGRQEEEPVDVTTLHVPFFGMGVAVFSRRLAVARVHVDSPSGGFVFGLTDPTDPRSTATRSVVPAGAATVEVHGAELAGLLVPAGTDVLAVTGVPSERFAAGDDSWERVEVVGLPVDQGEWSGVGDHAADQGLEGFPRSPRDAAVERVVRGTPPFGWRAEVEPGTAAPPWSPPDPVLLVEEVQADLLTPLRDVLVQDQLAQALSTFGVVVPPPSTLAGAQVPAADSTAQVSPVALLQLAVATDPFLSLVLGYGTDLAEPEHADVTPYHDGSTWDYMVTAPYARGLDGGSDEVELVAYAPRPVRVLQPPVATGLHVEHLAHSSPEGVDADWTASADVRWQRHLKTLLFRVASHAVARHAPGDLETTLLMEERPSGGLRPVAPQAGTDDPDPAFSHVPDPALVIPNDPGSRPLRYAVATQDLFGLWSPWRVAPHTVTQPAPTPPQVVAATLHTTAPPGGGKVCPGTLTVDVVWDWTDRSPASIELYGLLFVSLSRSASGPVPTTPPGLDRALFGGGAPVTLTFFGDMAALGGVPGDAELHYLDPSGSTEVDPGPAQGDEVRRYRLVLPGLLLDFTATAHIGLHLWAAGRERLAPGHTTATTGPLTTFASDPVAPRMLPPVVPLGSLPDADGRSHGRLTWPAVPGAAGYVVYRSDESTLLAHAGLPEPAVDASLSDRFEVLLDAFEARADRRPFTRHTAQPVTGTSLDVTLSRGSRSIALFVVVTTSPGRTEGPWPVAGPAARAALVALAAPRVAVLPPPQLVASARPDGTVHVAVTARSLQTLDRIDVHRTRVDDAARELDTMGPPVLQAPPAPAGWTLGAADGRPQLSGPDAPGASWRRVWYRAVVWGGADPLRGVLRGRSLPSNAFSVVVPPAGPPDLSAPTVSWGGGAADVLLSWTSSAPAGRTALGTHELLVRVEEVTSSGRARVVDVGAELSAVPTVEPPSGSGVWRADVTGYRALVRRSSTDAALEVLVRLVDPLGRLAQHRLTVPAGSALPEPELADLALSPVPGGGAVLSFTSAAPLLPGYVLRVVALRRGRTFPPLPPQLRRLVVEHALPDVPVARRRPPGGGGLSLVRAPGGGPRHRYAAVSPVPVNRFDVRLTAPDGRTATAEQEV